MNASSISVRPVVASDAEAIAAHLASALAAAEPTTLDPADCTPDAQRAFIDALPERGTYLAAIDEGTGAIVGVQSLLPNDVDPRVGEVHTFVGSELAWRGPRALLVEETVRRATELGYVELHAVLQRTNVTEHLGHAEQLFEFHPHRDKRFAVGVRCLLDPSEWNGAGWYVPIPGRFARRPARRRKPLPTLDAFAFSFAAAWVAAAVLVVGFRAFLPDYTWNESIQWGAEGVLAGFFVGLPWLVLALPWALTRNAQGRSTLGLTGARDALLITTIFTAPIALFALVVSASTGDPGNTMAGLRGTLVLLGGGFVLGFVLASICVQGHALLWHWASTRDRWLVRGVALALATAPVVASALWVE